MLSQWVSKAGPGVRSATEAAAAALEKEKSEAARLSVPYPAPKRKPGRVSRQKLYTELICKKIRTHRWQELERLQNSVVPSWWQKGMDLEPPPGVVDSAHESAEQLLAPAEVDSADENAEQLPAPPPEDAQPMEEEEEQQQQQQQPRKKAKKQQHAKTHLSRVLQVWFLTWSRMMMSSYKYPLTRCLALAAEWMPETFGKIHIDTPRKWHPVEPPATPPPAAATAAKQPGRARSLSEEQGRKLASIMHSLVEAGSAVSSSILQGIVVEQYGIHVSHRWACYFLRDIGLSYKASARCSKAVSVEEARQQQKLLKMKVLHSMVEHGVGWNQVYNLDETACHLLPSPLRAWTLRGRNAKGKWTADKQVVTCTLVCSPEGGPILSQLIFEGSTTACLPSAPPPARMRWTFSPTHWANSETLLQVFELIEEEVCRRSGGSLVNYLVVLDVAPSHCSHHFLAAVAERHAHARLVFVSPGHTAHSQPLDISYMRSFKAAMRRMSGRAFAQQILEGTTAHGSLTRKPALKVSLVGLVSCAVQALERGEHHLPGWSHIYEESPEAFAAIHAEACKLHSVGRLYTKPNEEDAEEEGFPEESDWEAEQEEDAASVSIAEACEAPVPESRAPLDMLPISWTPCVQDSRRVALGKFLAIRLAYGSASSRDILEACSLPAAPPPQPPAIIDVPAEETQIEVAVMPGQSAGSGTIRV